MQSREIGTAFFCEKFILIKLNCWLKKITRFTTDSQKGWARMFSVSILEKLITSDITSFSFQSIRLKVSAYNNILRLADYKSKQ